MVVASAISRYTAQCVWDFGYALSKTYDDRLAALGNQ